MWEDGIVQSVIEWIESADCSNDKNTKKRHLIQALNSAECIKDSKVKNDLKKLIQDKLKEL